DGRLIGAVSYSLGSFSKEPIAGITPIADMIDATSAPVVRPATARAVGAPVMHWPPSQEDYANALREAFARLNPSITLPANAAGITLGSAASWAGVSGGATLRPLSTPLTLSGFSGETRDLLTAAAADAGLLPVSGGNVPPPDNPDAPLQPGDA